MRKIVLIVGMVMCFNVSISQSVKMPVNIPTYDKDYGDFKVNVEGSLIEYVSIKNQTIHYAKNDRMKVLMETYINKEYGYSGYYELKKVIRARSVENLKNYLFGFWVSLKSGKVLIIMQRVGNGVTLIKN